MDGPNNGIILYHYRFSPFARRVAWYLALRKLDYAQCIQPAVLPRPDLEAIGVRYRRIPVLAIGRDVYCDTRIILNKLERLFPEGALRTSQPDQEAVRKLLEKWTVGGGLFAQAARLIPTDMPMLQDPKFQKDREDFNGRSWDKQAMERARPEAVVHIRDAFSTMETTLLADGRDWILRTERPSLADIEGIWVFHWLVQLRGALPESIISEKQYPKVFAWVNRFNRAIKDANAAAPQPATVHGGEATRRISVAPYAEPQAAIDELDPTGLKKGQNVEVWPTDSGFRHRDQGKLLGINKEEIVIMMDGRSKEQAIRLHFPRINFRVQAVDRPVSKL